MSVENNELHHAALHHTYRNLRKLATDSPIPAVRFAARSALAEIHVALIAVGEEFDYYTAAWSDSAQHPHPVEHREAEAS